MQMTTLTPLITSLERGKFSVGNGEDSLAKRELGFMGYVIGQKSGEAVAE